MVRGRLQFFKKSLNTWNVLKLVNMNLSLSMKNLEPKNAPKNGLVNTRPGSLSPARWHDKHTYPSFGTHRSNLQIKPRITRHNSADSVPTSNLVCI